MFTVQRKAFYIFSFFSIVTCNLSQAVDDQELINNQKRLAQYTIQQAQVRCYFLEKSEPKNNALATVLASGYDSISVMEAQKFIKDKSDTEGHPFIDIFQIKIQQKNQPHLTFNYPDISIEQANNLLACLQQESTPTS